MTNERGDALEVFEFNDQFWIGADTDLTEAQTQAARWQSATYLAKHCTGPYASRAEANAALVEFAAI